MKFLVMTAAVAAGATALFSQPAGAALSSAQRCPACLYAVSAIDREVANQTSTHKGKKLAEQKAAVRGILGSLCDDPQYFSNIGFANGRYVQLDNELNLGLGDVDRSDKHATDLAAACRRLVRNNEKKLVTSLADFRRQSREDLSKDLCTKWTDSCSFDYSKGSGAGGGKKAKTKISKSNKCLVDAIALAVKGDFDASVEKVACAVVEIPDPIEEEEKDEEEEEEEEEKEGEDSTNNDDDDELTVEDDE